MQIFESSLQSLGSLQLRRVLPVFKRPTPLRSVGPFVFLDHHGPTNMKTPFLVPEHPHIGLATLTYLFEGEILHKDSLGSSQVIKPGQFNLMIAGEWITHLEQALTHRIHGLQFWLALEEDFETMPASFEHREILPDLAIDGLKAKLVLGQYENLKVQSSFPGKAFFIAGDAPTTPVALDLSKLEELAAYVCTGKLKVNETEIQQGQLAVLDSRTILISGDPGSKWIIFGGAKRKSPLYMKWNFVASDEALIDAAVERWEEMTSI